MNDHMTAAALTSTAIRTPRAAAVAGIVFSVLLTATFVLIRSALHGKPDDAEDWLRDGGRRDSFVLALHLLPFAGIAAGLALVPRWLAAYGFATGLILLLATGLAPFVELAFPLWVFVLSTHILVGTLRPSESAAA